MITNFSNINGKSFHDYSSSCVPQRVNLFFGTNGSGKSSLAHWLSAQAADSTRLFDTEFVNRNISTRDSVDGVRLFVGSQINTDEKMQELKESLRKNAEESARWSGIQARALEELGRTISEYFDQGKKRFSTNRISQKPNFKMDPLHALELWKRDAEVEDAEKVENIHELEQKKALLRLQINKLNEDFSALDADSLADLTELLERSVAPSQETVTDLVAKWLQSGVGLHDETKPQQQCLFCNNQFETNLVFDAIKRKLDDEPTKMGKELNVGLRQVETLEKMLSTMKEIGGVNLTDADNACSALKDALTRKKKNLRESISFDRKRIADLVKLNASCKELIEGKEKESGRIEVVLSRIETTAKKWIGVKLRDDPKVMEYEKDINESTGNMKRLKKEEKDLEERRTTLEEESSDLKPFADLVNAAFTQMGFNFQLHVDSDNQSYIVKPIVEEAHFSVSDLSEGEVRFFGFLYFYFSLFEIYTDKQKKLQMGARVIVLDDPITSFDIDNRSYIVMLINHVAKLVVEEESDHQLFVLTHSSYDFHSFCYGVHASGHALARFHIHKDSLGASQISLVSGTEMKNYSDYYKLQFQDVLQFACLNKEDLELCPNPVQYCNKMRFVFESHARTHYNIENVTNAAFGDIKNNYLVPGEWDSNLKESLSVINGFSHGVSWTDSQVNQISSTGIQRCIRCVISVLTNKDCQHVVCMRPQSIAASDLKSRIDTWSRSLSEPAYTVLK